jgi:hypothetical protein
MSIKYEVLTYCLCTGWTNIWTVLDENGNWIAETFKSYKEAKECLEEHLKDYPEDDPDDFEITEVKA